jgi:Uma2 family endonuclease
MTTKANRIIRYYDSHEVEGAELTQSRIHHAVILRLMLVLQWIFNGKNVGVTGNVNFYQTASPNETAKSPDIAVVEGLETDPNNLEDTPSYYVGQEGPPPLVVFEIASKETWRQDLEDKPARYEAMGVNEYFVFDPNKRTFWTGPWRGYNRLIGWRKEAATSQYKLIAKDPQGRLWSEELESWLVVEGNDLQLYTAEGPRRLTKEEAEAERAEIAAQRAMFEAQRAEIERKRATFEAQRAETERKRAETEARRAAEAQLQAETEARRAAEAQLQAETEARRAAEAQLQAETERQENTLLKELLKKLGHNPDDLL